MARITLGVGAAACAWASVGAAHAGAWMGPERGQLISSVALGGGQSESDTYFEQRLWHGGALVAQPRIRMADDEKPADTDVSVGLKFAVLEAPNAAGAVQAAAVWRSEPGVGCGESGGEIRALGGISSGRAYYNVEAAWRVQENGCAARRFDLTMGYRFQAGWMALAQTFIEEVDGERSIKVQASLVTLGSDNGGLQIGVRFRVDGEDQEPALVLGWWGAPPRW